MESLVDVVSVVSVVAVVVVAVVVVGFLLVGLVDVSVSVAGDVFFVVSLFRLRGLGESVPSVPSLSAVC